MPLLPLLERLTKWLLIASLASLSAGGWQRDKLPEPDFYDSRIAQEPLQLPTRSKPFVARAGEQTYQIKPLFDYDLRGMVVSMHHADSFLDIYHHQDWGDYINIKDICVIWGDNVRSAVYQDMGFKNTTWTCWYSWPNGEVRRRFSEDQLSNNHLLADKPWVQDAIMDARPGDQVRLRGMLAEYRNPSNGFQRGSSVSRKDRGNGACETIYVQDFIIEQRANVGWRTLYTLGAWLAPLSAALLIVLMAITPIRRSVHR